MSPVDELPVAGMNAVSGGATPLNRRQALSLLAAGVASGLAACSKPTEEIIPYVRRPERIVGGEPLKFATTLALAGFGRGALVTTIDGRPIKIEGNPLHPASLGATDVFAEAAVLSLYDPDRSAAILEHGAIATADALRGAVRAQLELMRKNKGSGFRLLTGHITSPTLVRQIGTLLDRYPQAAWHAHDATCDENAMNGAALAYGRPLHAVPRLDRAAVVVALDADPLGHGPDQIRNARDFAARRDPARGGLSRIYSFEPVPTLTGSRADRRVALHPDLVGEVAIAIAGVLGAGVRPAALPDAIANDVRRAAADLTAHRGSALVLAGPALPPSIHALVHWINAGLQAPVDIISPKDVIGPRQPGNLADLARDLAAGAVTQLVMIGVNPAYDAPADLAFARGVARVPFSLHLGAYADETAAISAWHVPQNHALETWSDLRTADGTASLVQPVIRPLHRGWSSHDVLALLLDQGDASSHAMVRETWRSAGAQDEAWWRRALHDGVIAGSAASPVTADQPALPEIPAKPSPPDMTVVLRPDPSVWDGTFANNAWLQECPKPLTKQVWGNALMINPDDAGRRELADGDVVSLQVGDRSVEVPVLVVAGVAEGAAGLELGYGRARSGAIGNAIGTDAYPLRSAASPWLLRDARLARTGARQDILVTQNVVRGPDAEALFPMHAPADHDRAATGPAPETPPSLLPPAHPTDEPAWAMVIDTAICIGCNACVVSCQAENNVPVVGPDEIARGRDMHWLRVDVYERGAPGSPRTGFQPVPCMHCEHAPCEPVCPVAASVHDSEGLNAQVYNRCIGTRFCEANCPYKVRRFNFFGYADGDAYANLGFESYRAQRNPEVTVRSRGVMEKCTYCVQRISAARHAAILDHRTVGPDEVRTACQDACPTQAITFGDLRRPASGVSRRRTDDRHYALLGHLGTRPRTTYLADVRNPPKDGDAT